MPLNRAKLLALYDVADLRRPGRTIEGYDKAHAARTTRLVLKVAQRLDLRGDRLRKLEATALLHDIGRVGMEPELFGRIFQAAQRRGMPVRVGELVRRYPHVSKAQAARFFLDLVRPALVEEGIPVDDRVLEHIAMRMAFDQRVRWILAEKKSELRTLGITVEPWMEQVILYYYYPEVMDGAPEDVRLMGMVLVACENFEAYNNLSRARDYYGREQPSLREAFGMLKRFTGERIISEQIYQTLKELTLGGSLNAVIKESQGLPRRAPLRENDRNFLVELRQEAVMPPGAARH